MTDGKIHSIMGECNDVVAQWQACLQGNLFLSLAGRREEVRVCRASVRVRPATFCQSKLTPPTHFRRRADRTRLVPA